MEVDEQTFKLLLNRLVYLHGLSSHIPCAIESAHFHVRKLVSDLVCTRQSLHGVLVVDVTVAVMSEEHLLDVGDVGRLQDLVELVEHLEVLEGTRVNVHPFVDQLALVLHEEHLH